ncbi:DUF1697 domain-containing protein [Actinokineospora bangkokensis]|uniref:DUF1697 domain-containing protein n=1 Tax=Actinokineospora bangkokensis TaxID=1193682 RepID=A0A1Q9LS49_9PSEU|nr:DUF1697 domain-containing protein [Actinokineospora bangkokensis]OLR94814.1 hypothetical protein BJP25_09275 [Actinokineospora bangkokensis]
MTRFVALLRAVNIGGTSSMPMAELREVLTGAGLTDVRTYIQSGNAVFAAGSSDEAEVAEVVRGAIRARWGKDIPVLLRTADELDAVIAANPYLGEQDDLTKLHVTFLDREPGQDKVATLVPPAGETGVLTVIGREVFLHVPDGYGRTKLQNVFVERRTGAVSTTRNWKSVLKLREMVTAG